MGHGLEFSRLRPITIRRPMVQKQRLYPRVEIQAGFLEEVSSGPEGS